MAMLLWGNSYGQDISEVSAVRSAYDEFKESTLSSKGAISAGRVTKATLEYYDEIRRAALTTTRENLQRMSLDKQILVLRMRMSLSHSDLKKMSGKDLFAYAVDQGWIANKRAREEDITDIKVTGNRAQAHGTISGQTTNQLVHFIKEDGAWKYDMIQVLNGIGPLFDDLHRQSGLGKEMFVSRIIENVTGRKPTDVDWNPRPAKQKATGQPATTGESK